MMVTVERATRENFAPFGSLVSLPDRDPTASGSNYRFWSDLAHYTIHGETEIGLCTACAESMENLTGLERHVATPEILIPIDAPFLCPLLLDKDPEDRIRFFRVDPGEAVVIDASVWHGACLPLGRSESSYFVVFRRFTPRQDVEKRSIQPVRIF